MIDKNKWFQMDKKAKASYIDEKLDKLKAAEERDERKELEKEIFQLITWQEENDE